MAAVETARTVRSQAKFVRSSARKARLVTDLIRGRTVPEARTILAFSDRAVARDVERVLRSAVANAESRPDLLWNGDELVVATAYADEGPTLKRHRARARGRVGRIMKRTCHITVELVQSPEAAARAALEAAQPRRRRRPAAETGAATEAAVADETTVEEPTEPEAVAEEPTDEPTTEEPTEEPTTEEPPTEETENR
jgi:large subunit ribosomal protein L22